MCSERKTLRLRKNFRSSKLGMEHAGPVMEWGCLLILTRVCDRVPMCARMCRVDAVYPCMCRSVPCGCCVPTSVRACAVWMLNCTFNDMTVPSLQATSGGVHCRWLYQVIEVGAVVPQATHPVPGHRGQCCSPVPAGVGCVSAGKGLGWAEPGPAVPRASAPGGEGAL